MVTKIKLSYLKSKLIEFVFVSIFTLNHDMRLISISGISTSISPMYNDPDNLNHL